MQTLLLLELERKLLLLNKLQLLSMLLLFVKLKLGVLYVVLKEKTEV